MGAYASHRGGFDANKMSWCGSKEGFCLALLTFHKAVGALTFSEIPQKQWEVTFLVFFTRCPALLVVGDNSPAVEAVVRIHKHIPCMT